MCPRQAAGLPNNLAMSFQLQDELKLEEVLLFTGIT